MFGSEKIKKIKISNSVKNEIKNDAILAEKKNIIICGVLQGEIKCINTFFKKTCYANCKTIINFNALFSSNMIKKIKRIKKDGFFSREYHDIVFPIDDIIKQRQDAIGMYVFFPRSMKKLKEEIKTTYSKKHGPYKLLLLAYFINAGTIFKKEKSEENENNTDEIRNLQIASMQMDISCFEKNMNPVNIEIVV